MRVLYLSKACVVGAYQRKLEDLAGIADVSLVAAVPPFWQNAGHKLALERLHTQGYHLHIEPVRFNGHFHLHYYPRLGKLLDRVRPEIFHVDEEPYNLATFHAFYLAQKRNIPALFFTWQNIARQYPVPFSWMERYVYRRAAGAIAGNSEAADVLRAKGFTGPVQVIPQFGVDPQQFSPAETPMPANRPFTVGFAGRLVEEKGLFVLLDAMNRLEADWRLRILGRGPLEPALQNRVHNLGLDSQVTLEGTLPSAQMPNFYRQLDVLVLPSLTRANWKEQFGRVLIEAMACGVPVVGSDSGEIARVIGDAGLIFPEGDGHTLAAQLQRLIETPQERRSLSRRGRRHVQAKYTHAHIARQTVDVYRGVLRT